MWWDIKVSKRSKHMFRFLALLCFAVGLAGCQTTQTAKMTPDEVAQNWAGEWRGTFSRGCNAALVITKVGATSAHVVYKYTGNCGGSSSGEIIDPTAQLAGTNLRVDLGGGYKITADILSGESLKTKFSYPAGRPAFATFKKRAS